MTESRLRRLRWTVRATLALGVAASVTANILHAQDNPISQAIAAWPPLALLITVELVSRIPIVHRGLGAVRVLATAAIAGIAAWVSYWHMVGVVARYGETGSVPYLLPLSVDGLIVVASASLVELSARHRDTTSASARAEAEVDAPAAETPIAVEVASAAPAVATDSAATPPAPEPASDDAVLAEAAPARSMLDPAVKPVDGLSNYRLAAGLEPDSTRGADLDEEDDDKNGDDSFNADDTDHGDDGAVLAADLLPLLSAARDARDELTQEGRAVSRDALARRLRRNGHAIRNNRVSELLNALRQESRSNNGSRPKLPA